MDYTQLLVLHSYYRWIVLLALTLFFLWLYVQHRRKTVFTKPHFYALIGFCILMNIQFLLGLLLYLCSPLVEHFWKDFGAGVKNRQLRFFGMEHVTMMSLAVIFINYYTLKVKHKIGQATAFTYLWKRFRWLLLIILSSVPWSWSPLTSRPNWR